MGFEPLEASIYKLNFSNGFLCINVCFIIPVAKMKRKQNNKSQESRSKTNEKIVSRIVRTTQGSIGTTGGSSERKKP
jgi:hypothetical protein